jgi:hypothetical protein
MDSSKQYHTAAILTNAFIFQTLQYLRYLSVYFCCFNKLNKSPSLHVGFEVFTAVVMKSIIFWDVTPCSLLRCNRRFGGTYRIHLQGRRKFCLPPAYLLVLAEIFFDPEDGGDMFLRNVCCISTHYTASHPRRWYASSPPLQFIKNTSDVKPCHLLASLPFLRLSVSPSLV